MKTYTSQSKCRRDIFDTRTIYIFIFFTKRRSGGGWSATIKKIYEFCNREHIYIGSGEEEKAISDVDLVYINLIRCSGKKYITNVNTCSIFCIVSQYRGGPGNRSSEYVGIYAIPKPNHPEPMYIYRVNIYIYI